MKSFRVDEWLVEPALNQIERDGVKNRLEPRSMDVLVALAEHPGEVLSKESLLEKVWTDTHVGDEALTHAIWEIRKAFGDDARNPTYIQTIHKRGYRLVATVVELDENGEPKLEEPDPTSARGRFWRTAAGLLALLLAGSVGWVVSGRDEVGLEPLVREAEKRVRYEKPLLVLGPLDKRDVADPGVEAIYEDLARRLSGGDVFRLARPDGIEVANRELDPADHFLELTIGSSSTHSIVMTVFKINSGEAVFAKSVELADAASPKTAAETFSDQLLTFGNANLNKLAHDPHIAAWINWSTHNHEAVSEFLSGAGYTLSFEPGGAPNYERAIKLDRAQNFLAPWIWLTPSFVPTEKEAERNAHLEQLDKFRNDATTFERAMIDWAFEVVKPEADYRRMRQVLRQAIEAERKDGPTRVVLAATHAEFGDLEAALQALEPLIDDAWVYPSIYPQAAGYAIRLGDFDRAQALLEQGLKVLNTSEAFHPGVDTWVLLEAFALLDGDQEKAETMGMRILRTLGNDKPEEETLPSRPALERLLTLAREEGKTAAAHRILTRLDQFEKEKPNGVSPTP